MRKIFSLLMFIFVFFILFSCDLLKSVNLITKADIPKGLIATKEQNGIKIKWNAIPNVDGYKLYKAVEKDENYLLIKDLTADFFIDADVTVDKTYYYRIKAYNKYGESDLSISVLISTGIATTTSTSTTTTTISTTLSIWSVSGVIANTTYAEWFLPETDLNTKIVAVRNADVATFEVAPSITACYGIPGGIGNASIDLSADFTNDVPFKLFTSDNTPSYGIPFGTELPYFTVKKSGNDYIYTLDLSKIDLSHVESQNSAPQMTQEILSDCTFYILADAATGVSTKLAITMWGTKIAKMTKK
ncbi:MAG: hypothetical protein A2086_04565 [Spirochaetes bacterium GWD1_27_9]|nr:MAG: hypothetical protein A2Z98_13655 [Spirochaetes bacterium GWB1_27_13]OHD27593.1 MAG: hypothetical protein A2Y34_18200 [Spirochaetes bacterium GWC1_27_15]OHD30345.1 MAG: hypothetical protein A2086_04565 [Spirochaetes bacterium GWD1_27_9]